MVSIWGLAWLLNLNVFTYIYINNVFCSSAWTVTPSLSPTTDFYCLIRTSDLWYVFKIQYEANNPFFSVIRIIICYIFVQFQDNILKPSYNSVDMVEVELLDDDSAPRNFSKMLLDVILYTCNYLSIFLFNIRISEGTWWHHKS